LRVKVKSSLLVSLCLTLAGGSFAQGIYKSIGPDGKVVYSDKPPGSATDKYDVVRAPASAPQARAGTGAVDQSAGVAEPSSPGRHAAKRATRAEPSRSEPPAEPAVDPAIEKAVIGVLGLEDLVLQTEDICIRALPTSMRKYGDAAAGWKQRNGAVVTQMRSVLSQAFVASQRQLIEAGVKSRNQQALSSVVNAPTASKIKWCDQSSDDINKGTLDPARKDNLASPLMNYRSRQS
jgi:hypothetical protein